MELPSSSSEHRPGDYSSSFHVGETSSANVKIGSSADEGGENHVEPGALNPGGSSDHSSSIDIVEIGSPADDGGKNHAEPAGASNPGDSSDKSSSIDIVEIGSPADDQGENHAEPGASNPGDSSDQSSSIDIESDSLLTTKNCRVLYLAALAGDWERAKFFFKGNQAQANSCCSLTARNETALHIAAAAEQTNFVENLVKIMRSKDLAFETEYGYTALCFAAISGNVRMGEVLVKKNAGLPNLCGNNGSASFPLYLAVTHKRRDMTHYLLPKTELRNFEISNRVNLLHATILSDYYDIGLKILQKNEDLAVERNNSGETALHALARKANKIGSQSQLTIWEKYCLNMIGFKKMYNKALMKTFAHQMVDILWTTVTKNITEEQRMLDFINTPTNFLYEAAKVGNTEFLVLLIRKYPDLISKLDYNFINVFYEAVENRQEKVFELIYEMGLKNMFGDLGGVRNTKLMHLATQIAAPKHLKRISNPALQMTRELEWYKEVKKIVRVSPLEDDAWRETFNKEHKQLREEGEEWVKRVSTSCMLVATLIASAIFAATFNLKIINIAFLVADSLALYSSIFSIITFLSVLTSRFAEEDFFTLPFHLFIGFAYLFFSILCMFTAFCATLIRLDRKSIFQWTGTFLGVNLSIFCVWYDAFKSSVWSDIACATILCKFPLERRRWRRRMQL